MSDPNNYPYSSVYESSYECSITVDCSIFGFQNNELKILLGKRSIQPYKDHWQLPGGLMNEGQTLNEAVNSVLFDLTGIHDVHQEQVRCYSEVERHPLKRVVTVSFYALIKPENHPAIAKDYVSEVRWFPVNEVPNKLGFDHEVLFMDSLGKLRKNLKENLIFGELLSKKFTLKELQDLYESILGEKLDRRNFRKKIFQLDLLENTNQKKAGTRGGPDLYSIKKY